MNRYCNFQDEISPNTTNQKKGYYSTQKVTFYDINDAIWWEKVILERVVRTVIIPVD